MELQLLNYWQLLDILFLKSFRDYYSLIPFQTYAEEEDKVSMHAKLNMYITNQSLNNKVIFHQLVDLYSFQNYKQNF